MKKLWHQFNSWLGKHSNVLGAWSSLIQIIIFPTVLITVILGYIQIRDYVQKADLHLEFSSPVEISYTIINKSSTTAEIPSVGFGIFDLDSKPVNTVPIVCREFPYLRGSDAQGPNSLLQNYGKIGHRYFGFAYVFAKNTSADRWYWIYWVHGQKTGAWYIELGDKDPKMWNPIALMKQPEEYIKSNMPENKRVSIW